MENEIDLQEIQNIFNIEPTETTQEEDVNIEDVLLDVSTEEVNSEETVEEENNEEGSSVIVPTETDSYKALKLLIETGELEDVVLELEDGEKQLSDFTDIDAETLKDVINTFKAEKETAREKDYIKVKGLTDTQQKLIDIVSKGNYSDLQEIFKNPENLREPWEGYDSSNESHNEQVVRAHLTHVQGLTAEEVEALVKVAKETLTLDTKAQAYVQQQRDNFKKGLEEKAKNLEASKKEEVEKTKQFTKDLTEKFKSMELKPELALAMVKTATQKTSNQTTTALDDLYQETLKDVDKASDLILFLTNKEVYDARIQSKTKLQEQVDYAKKIKIVRDTKKTATIEEAKNKNADDVISDIFSIQ